MNEQDRYGNLRSSLGGFLSVLWDLILLNFFWILCSLPVVTIGPATSALFAVTLKIAGDEQVSLVKDYFAAFKRGFPRSFILGLLGFFAAVVIYADGWYAVNSLGAAKIVFGVLTGFLVAVFINYFSYIFALEARYDNSIKNHIRNAFALAFCAPGKTVTMWMIYIIPLALILFLPQDVLAYVGVAYIMIGMSFPALLGSRILREIFARYQSGGDSQESEKDEDRS